MNRQRHFEIRIDDSLQRRRWKVLGGDRHPAQQNDDAGEEAAHGANATLGSSNEDRVRVLGLPQESRGFRGHARHGRERRSRNHRRRVASRRAGGEHLRVHRSRQAGIDRYDPRDGGAQEAGRGPETHRHRVSRRALSRGTEKRNPRDRRDLGTGEIDASREPYPETGTGNQEPRRPYLLYASRLYSASTCRPTFTTPTPRASA